MSESNKPVSWSMYERKDGRWCAERISLYTSEGKPKKEYIYAKTEDELKWKVSQRDRLAAGSFNGDTVGEWLEYWMKQYVEPTAKINTINTYYSVIDNNVMPVLGGMKLIHLSEDAVRQVTNPLVRADRHESARLTRNILNHAFRVALDMKLIQENPCHRIRIAKGPKARPKVMDDEEVHQFTEAVQKDVLCPLWLILLTMGLRSAEARGLQWQDVNLKDGTLTVKRQIQWEKGVLTYISPKSASAYRTLPIPHVTLEALVHHYESLDPLARLGTSPIFLNAMGRLITPQYLRQRFNKLLQQAGIPHMKLHDLRHTCATILIGKNIPMKTVQEWLGHSDYRITADIYSHVTGSMLDAAAVTMNGVFD